MYSLVSKTNVDSIKMHGTNIKVKTWRNYARPPIYPLKDEVNPNNLGQYRIAKFYVTDEAKQRFNFNAANGR